MPSKSIYSSVFCVGADFETIMPTKPLVSFGILLGIKPVNSIHA